jgi:hypothetical protein
MPVGVTNQKGELINLKNFLMSQATFSYPTNPDEWTKNQQTNTNDEEQSVKD